MQCYSELTPPTAVTHSVVLSFLSATSSNLVVAKSSLLQIFETKLVTTDVPSSTSDNLKKAPSTTHFDAQQTNDGDGTLEASYLGGDASWPKAAHPQATTKLVLVSEIPLSGTITGLAQTKLPSSAQSKSGGEGLLVLFKDAKLSLLEWDPDTYGVSTLSIHYYEQEELQEAPWAPPLCKVKNELVADPGSRCAVLRFGVRNLAVLPMVGGDGDLDEDMEGDDWDEELDGPRPEKVEKQEKTREVVNGADGHERGPPYAPSFVLRLSNLDPKLSHPIHLAFLHEYREPTFGILSSSIDPSTNVLDRRAVLSYMVFTIDLQQKASTTILSVGDLPSDLFRVVALPSPVGGAVLIGENEIIHVDQSGSRNGVAVNPFGKQQGGSMVLADQTSLNLRLEGCAVEIFSPEAGSLLLVTTSGKMVVVDVKTDGRKVSGLTVNVIKPASSSGLVASSASTISRLSKNTLFVGSETGDSVVLGWSRRSKQSSRRKSVKAEEAVDDLSDSDDDDDDLYASAGAAQQSSGGSSSHAELSLRLHDRLVSTAPIRDLTYGSGSIDASDSEPTLSDVRSDLQLVTAVGRGAASSLAILNRNIQPKVVGRFEFSEARGLWTLTAQKPVPKSLQGDKAGATTLGDDYDAAAQYDKFMIAAKVGADGSESSDIYALTAAGFEALTGTEFEPAAGLTIEAGTMGQGKRIVQILKNEVRSYDGDLGLDMILPLQEEETEEDPKVISASLLDPYLLLVKDDATVFVATMNDDLELEELAKTDVALMSTQWLSGCLYSDVSGAFTETEQSNDSPPSILIFLLSANASLHVYRLPDLSKPALVINGLGFIPFLLAPDYTARRGTQREALTELLVADLGDATAKAPYLILRHANDDLTLYEPRRTRKAKSAELADSLVFRKAASSTFAKSVLEATQDDAETVPRNIPLRACSNIAGYSTVFLPGASASFLLKSATSTPKLIGLQGSGVRGLSTFHTEGCERGFIYADSEGIARVSQFPEHTSYADIGMSLRKVPLHQDAATVTYHARAQVYVVGTMTEEDFELPKEDDSVRPQQIVLWQKEKLTMKPQMARGHLKVISPVHWSVIDEVELEPLEYVTCIQAMDLELSEITRERRELIVVGTTINRGEDLVMHGALRVYDVATVNPQPGRPETRHKLKLIAKENASPGGVTAISKIGTEGFVLMAKGQKCTVRGLKEDGTLLPVAFMDMQNYVPAIKEIPGTGLLALADAFKGVWFAGYTQEPYRMILYGKSNSMLEVMNVEFMPDGRELYIVAMDVEGNLQVFQFDPEHPKSHAGRYLLHKTTFNTGAHIPLVSKMLPRTFPSLEALPQTNGVNGHTNGTTQQTMPPQILLLASPTGSLASLVQLSETSYRRLASLSSQLNNSLPQAAGLNPKAYRMPPSSTQGLAKQSAGVDLGMGRDIVDGNVLRRWSELATGRRNEIVGRAGYGDASEVRAELEGVLGWEGMAYF